MLEWRPAFGTLIGAQIVLSTEFWVWAKLFFSRHRHRLRHPSLACVTQMWSGDFLTTSGKILSLPHPNLRMSQKQKLVGGGGIEPPTSSSSTTRSPTELTAHLIGTQNYSTQSVMREAGCVMSNSPSLRFSASPFLPSLVPCPMPPAPYERTMGSMSRYSQAATNSPTQSPKTAWMWLQEKFLAMTSIGQSNRAKA